MLKYRQLKLIRSDILSLDEKAALMAITHIFFIPFILFLVSNREFSLITGIIYIAVISFLQWYRSKCFPTYENIFKKDVFFDVLKFIILILSCFLILLFILVIK